MSDLLLHLLLHGTDLFLKATIPLPFPHHHPKFLALGLLWPLLSLPHTGAISTCACVVSTGTPRAATPASGESCLAERKAGLLSLPSKDRSKQIITSFFHSALEVLVLRIRGCCFPGYRRATKQKETGGKKCHAVHCEHRDPARLS